MRFDEALVQQTAVLRPLIGTQLTDACSSDAVQQLLKTWQYRIDELAHLWTPEIASRMRYCRPSMAMLERGKDAFFCRYSYICPWCWARKVRAEYLRLVVKMRATFKLNDPKAGPVDVWYINLIYPLVFKAGGVANRLCHDALIGNLQQARVALSKTAKDHDAHGGYCYMHVDMITRKNTWFWYMRAPGVLVVPAGTAMPQVYKDLGGKVFHTSRKTKIPPLRSLAYVLGRCRKYPTGLMKGPVPLVEELLAIRSGLRLDASVGILHGCGYLKDFHKRKETFV